MILPIYSYGHSVLRQKCLETDPNDPELGPLIDHMWETMYGARGCGLAAPQIGEPVRLFLVDSKRTYKLMREDRRKEFYEPGDTGLVETFINAKIISRSGDNWLDDEGCLSIPHLLGKVERPWTIEIEYLDREGNQKLETFSGLTARMIQHEYDHIEGILYLDYFSAAQIEKIQNKLEKISQGVLPVKYPMKFVE